MFFFFLNQNEKIESINVLNSFILNMKKVSLQRLHKKKRIKEELRRKHENDNLFCLIL